MLCSLLASFLLAQAAPQAAPRAALQAAPQAAPQAKPAGSSVAVSEAPVGSSLRDPLPPAPSAPPPAGPVLALAEALRLARESNPDLAIAKERIVAADIQVSRAWDALKPVLLGSISETHNSLGALELDKKTFAIAATGSKNAFAASLNASWTLFNGRAIPAIQSAKQLVDVARLNESTQQRALLVSVAQVYFSGATLRQLAAVAFEQAQATRGHASQAMARFEAGLIQRSAAVRARVDVVRADEEARRATFSYLTVKSQLVALLDKHDTDFELEPPQQAPEEIRGAFKELFEKALRERPELAAARANEEIAARLKTDAWAQFLPTLSAVGNARYNDPSQQLTGENSVWSVALALTLPLYDGGFRYAALHDADSQLRSAKQLTRSSSNRVEDELRRAQIAIDSFKALREEAVQEVAAAKENNELIAAQFAAGTATQVEVSDATAALFQSQATLLQQQLNVQLAALQLAYAVGAFDP